MEKCLGNSHIENIKTSKFVRYTFIIYSSFRFYTNGKSNMEFQLIKFVNIKKVVPNVQSGIRKGYSCTTANLHITDGILNVTDGRPQFSLALLLLDYTKAFHTIDHSLLFMWISHIDSKMCY